MATWVPDLHDFLLFVSRKIPYVFVNKIFSEFLNYSHWLISWSIFSANWASRSNGRVTGFEKSSTSWNAWFCSRKMSGKVVHNKEGKNPIFFSSISIKMWRQDIFSNYLFRKLRVTVITSNRLKSEYGISNKCIARTYDVTSIVKNGICHKELTGPEKYDQKLMFILLLQCLLKVFLRTRYHWNKKDKKSLFFEIVKIIGNSEKIN